MAKPLRICCLFPRLAWERKMDPNRRYAIEAISAHPEVELVQSGRLWGNYKPQQTAQENIDRLLPGADLILWYKPHLHPWAYQHRTPACVLYNDCWSVEHSADESRSARANLIVCHHANDLPRFDTLRAEADWPLEAVHLPHCAAAERFDPLPWAERSIDVLLTGVHSPEIYPLRAKFQQAVQAGLIPGGVIRSHPGYELKGVADVDRQYDDYARELCRAKIVLVCSSVYKYALSKYVEGAMAGAMVIGDAPDERTAEFSRWLVEVSPEASVEELAEVVRGWLARPAEAAYRAAVGRELALSQYSYQHYAERFVAAARAHLARFHGGSA